MATLNEIIQKYSRLDSAIESALKNEVAEVVRGAVAQSAIENVYGTYDPVFRHRRGEMGEPGGITDPDSVHVEVFGTELRASDDAPYQQLWGGTRPSSPRLAEAIATGDPRFHMEKAGPRPFHEKAKERVISSGEIERALRKGLERQGFSTTGLEFSII